MIRIKICGIQTIETAIAAANAGADAIGMVFAPSRRQIKVATAREICQALPPFISKVGVFVNADQQEVQEIAQVCGLDTLQFHGQESPQYCDRFTQKVIKAFQIREENSLTLLEGYQKYTVLFDSYSKGQVGGTGQVFPWKLARQSGMRNKMILAGGLHAGNVIHAIQMVNPFGVDVSSGVETEGHKDVTKIKEFIRKIRRWECYGS